MVHRNNTVASGARDTQRVWFAQGLRGPACLFVVWGHLGNDFWASPGVVSVLAFTPADPRRIRPPAVQTSVFEFFNHVHFRPGPFGVALFFLISGFVIPFSLQGNTVGGFVTRRFFRLYPTLWVAIGVPSWACRPGSSATRSHTAAA